MSNRPVSIYRDKPRENAYFLMARCTAQDTSLSWAARGVLAYLLSKPDDWTIKVSDLEQNCRRDKVYSILDELEKAKYLIRQEVKDGKWADGRWRYQLFERPYTEIPATDKTEIPPTPKPEKPATDKTATEKSVPYILENKTLQNPESTNNTPGAPAPEVVQPEPALPVGTIPEVDVEYNPQPIPSEKALVKAPPKISATPPPKKARPKKQAVAVQEELPDLEMQLMLFALWKVTGRDYRLVSKVRDEAKRYRRLGYTAEDVVKAQQICKRTDWRWTDPKKGNPDRRMYLQDVTDYLGSVKVSSNEFTYAPEMELDQLIRRVRATGDFAALEPGYSTPALPCGESPALPAVTEPDDNPFLKKDAPLPIRTVASELDKLGAN